MPTSPLFILLILFLNIAICEWLVRRPFFKAVGTAMLVILLTAIVANLGIIPSASSAPPIYDHVFAYIAPLAIFYLLLEANIGVIRKAGLPILILFLIGSIGTTIGAICGGYLTNGHEKIGEFFPPLAGMFTGTYSGGSINFNAVALHYEVNKEGTLYAGAVAIDNIITALWMIATIGLPKILNRILPRVKSPGIGAGHTLSEKDKSDTESVNPKHLSILIVLGILTYFISEWLASWFFKLGIRVPAILILTTISLILAQLKIIQSLRGARVLGIIGIYLFLAIIGAYCEIATLPKIGMLAYHILAFAAITVAVHGLITFGLGGLFKQDWDLIAIASQANVGGSGSALALARSMDRHDLLLPAILLGTLGNALGTYLGFFIAGYF